MNERLSEGPSSWFSKSDFGVGFEAVWAHISEPWGVEQVFLSRRLLDLLERKRKVKSKKEIFSVFILFGGFGDHT